MSKWCYFLTVRELKLDLIHGEILDVATAGQRVRNTSELVITAWHEVVETPTQCQSGRLHCLVVVIRQGATVLRPRFAAIVQLFQIVVVVVEYRSDPDARHARTQR